MIRALCGDDYQPFFNLTRATFPKRDEAFVSADTVDTLLNQDKNTVLGYFDGTELVTALAVRHGTLHGEGMWTVSHFFTSRPSNHFSFSRPDYGMLVAEAFRIAEELKIYSYMYAIPVKLQRVYYERWKTNPYLPPTGRYETSVLATVLANTVPSENWLARMIGQSKPYDLVINKRTLREEFR